MALHWSKFIGIWLTEVMWGLLCPIAENCN